MGKSTRQNQRQRQRQSRAGSKPEAEEASQVLEDASTGPADGGLTGSRSNVDVEDPKGKPTAGGPADGTPVGPHSDVDVEDPPAASIPGGPRSDVDAEDPKGCPLQVCSECGRPLDSGPVELKQDDEENPLCFVCFFNRAKKQLAGKPYVDDMLVLLFANLVGAEDSQQWLATMLGQKALADKFKDDPEGARKMFEDAQRKKEQAGGG